MSTTIDSLDIQITSSAGGATQNIEALATALGKLKSTGSLTKVTNNLTKLSGALTALQGSSSGLQSLNSLATALSSLSSLQKPSGLNSALNTLKKLPEITAALDEGTIDAFTARIQKLSDALGPLATKINQVAAGFKKLPSQVSKTVTATNRMAEATEKAADAADELNSNQINMAASIANIQTVIESLQWFTDQITAAIAAAIEWDGIQYRFGRAFGEDADEVYAHVQRISDVMKINMQEFMQYSSLYGSLLSGFGMEQEKVTAISVGLTELSYDIWAAYNDRYKTLEDASEAVRSAITGEIEPIRNAGIALTEASMQEYLDSLGMAHIRMANLSEAQKAEVRYATMVNAAMQQGIVGTYAKEMHTAEGAVRTLSQQLKGLVQGIGSLFIPILSAVIPWVSAFVGVLYDAVAAVAAFFGISFFKIDWGGQSKGLGTVADSATEAANALTGAGGAAKKLKDYTMGFDELNIISPDTGGGGGGGGGAAIGEDGLGLDLETLWDESVFAAASKQIDEIRGKIDTFFNKWKTEIAIVAGGLAALGIGALLGQIGEAMHLGDKFLGMTKTLQKLGGSAIVIGLEFALVKSSFSKFMSEDGSLWDYVAGLLIGGAASWVLYSMWGPAGLVIGFGVTAAAAISAVIDNGGINSVESAATAFTGLASAIGAVSIAWNKLVPKFKGTNLAAFLALLKEGNGIVPTLAAAFPKLSAALSTVAGWFSTAAGAVGTFIGGLSAAALAVIAAVIAAVASAVYFLAKNWKEVSAAVKEFFKTNIEPKLEKIKEHWEDIKKAVEPLGPIFSKLKKKLDPIIKAVGDFFKDIDIEGILSGIGKAVEWLGGIVASILGGAVAGVFSALVSAVENVVQVFSGLIQTISGVVQFIVAIFTGGDIKAAAMTIVDGVVDVFAGLGGLVFGTLEAFVQGVIDWFVALYDELVGHSVVPDMIEEIVQWFKDLPDLVLDSLKKFFNDVVDKFEELWADLTSWWDDKEELEEYTPEIGSIQTKLSAAWDIAKNWWTNTKAKLAEYTPNIGSIKDKLTAAWNTAKGWWDKTKGVLATYTPNIGSIRDKLSSAWSSAKEWWNKAKGVLTTYTPNIGSIRDKLSSAWTTARNWWNKSKSALATYTPSIGSIKSKLESAWKTAKTWWNNNVRLSIPSLNFKVTFTKKGLNSVQRAVVKALGLDGWPSLRFAANGGIFNAGSLIWAGEAGPEVVANASGGKTGVMNIDQMQAAVYEGVYAAVAAAMSRNSGGGNAPQVLNVYLDGKQITAVVEKNQKERGVQFMGTEVYSY